MNIIEIINKKRLGKILSEEEIAYAVNGYLSGEVKDYQMSSLLMAIVLKGLTDHEIITLTTIMLNSGEKLDLSSLGTVVDKHSTGGVGDKTTLIVAPIVASCGGRVAKMSGRGLGHTGGTIDKLESIPGFQVALDEKTFLNQVKTIGLAVVSQTNNLVPADKKIYALRDVTGTVESIPLIASSIMSKKIASGAKKLVIDVKVGKGALIKTLKDAQKLAKLMIQIGASHGIEVVCILSNMDIPLGNNIGNALEVKEAMEVLQGKTGHLTDLCIEIATQMVHLDLNISTKEAKKLVQKNITNGNAYHKFLEFVGAQGGNISNLPQSTYQYEILSKKSGFIDTIDALLLGNLSMHLGSQFKEIIKKLESEIYKISGEEFNINSPKQLGVILFEKLGLPVIKKTKTGYSTNAEVLDKLKDQSPIIDKIIEYRQIVKLNSTYVEGLLSIINPIDGRIHSSFNQTITTTGRISSTEPNLQNIPVKLEMGRNIRKVFISDKGCKLVDADYSQVELRVLAHMSQDETMIDAFKHNEDIHTKTASQVFNVSMDEVTSKQRSDAKAVNFGIVYGKSDFGLSEDLNIPVKQAKEYIENYFNKYNKIKEFMDNIIDDASSNGYVTTILNRRRYIPEIKSSNFMLRNAGKTNENKKKI